MIDIIVIIRKNRKNRNLYFRVKANRAKLGEVSTGLFCKPSQWLGSRWCRITGKMSKEDRNNNIRTNKAIGDLIEKYRLAWDKLNELGQQEINFDDLKLAIEGNHPSMLYDGRRLSLSDAAQKYVDQYVKTKNRRWKETKTRIATICKLIYKEADNDKITIDQVSEQIAFNVYQSLCNEKYTYNKRTCFYSYKSRRNYMANMRNMFEWFYIHKNRLEFVPILPEVNPFKNIKVERIYREDVVWENGTSKKVSVKEPLSLVNKEVHFYSSEEQEKLASIELPPVLNYYRNVLLWQIHTGLAFTDIRKFDPDKHLDRDIDGDYWLVQSRMKTDVKADLPLGDEAMALLEFFKNQNPYYIEKMNDIRYVLINSGDMTTYRKYLTIIGDIVGFKLTKTHKARHTFAVNMLNRGYEMEEVSRMMGHATVATTDNAYGFVTRDRVRQRRKLLQNNLLASPLKVNRNDGTNG